MKHEQYKSYHLGMRDSYPETRIFFFCFLKIVLSLLKFQVRDLWYDYEVKSRETVFCKYLASYNLDDICSYKLQGRRVCYLKLISF